jgi:hypothetical protein
MGSEGIGVAVSIMEHANNSAFPIQKRRKLLASCMQQITNFLNEET